MPLLETATEAKKAVTGKDTSKQEGSPTCQNTETASKGTVRDTCFWTLYL